MKAHRLYKLQEYDSRWKKRFLAAAIKLKPVFGNNLVEMVHIGSTSIEGMAAKPQVDILAVVKNLDRVKDRYDAFKKAGFTALGRGYVANDDEYLVHDSPDGRRLVSVHTLQQGNPKIAEFKLFRDYLAKNKKERDLYIAVKKQLYSLYQDNYEAYDIGKKDIIAAIKSRARQWAADSWGKSMDFEGVIIEESLADKSLLKDVKILSTRIESVTEKHQTPWLKQWTLHNVEVPFDKAAALAEKISKALDREHDWYADYKTETQHYIIYRDKVFHITDRSDKKQYDKATEYGISLSIPSLQVDFSPHVTKWQR
jgi:GrpB-like predicted nucleotidyltransferase (UPF0157 family)